jgi:hypothetical protein
MAVRVPLEDNARTGQEKSWTERAQQPPRPSLAVESNETRRSWLDHLEGSLANSRPMIVTVVGF